MYTTIIKFYTLPYTVRIASSNALLSLIVTPARVPDDEATNATVLEKVLDESRVILCPPATVKVDAPVIANTPLSVIPPPDVAVTS